GQPPVQAADGRSHRRIIRRAAGKDDLGGLADGRCTAATRTESALRSASSNGALAFCSLTVVLTFRWSLAARGRGHGRPRLEMGGPGGRPPPLCPLPWSSPSRCSPIRSGWL